jgi:hypothetical protein
MARAQKKLHASPLFASVFFESTSGPVVLLGDFLPAPEIFSLRLCSKVLNLVCETWRSHRVLSKRVTRRLELLFGSPTVPLLELMRAKGGVIGGQFLFAVLVDLETIPFEVDMYLCGNYFRFLADTCEVLARRLLFHSGSGSDFIVQFPADEGKTEARMMLHVTERRVLEHNTCFDAEFMKNSFDGRKLVVEMKAICESWREDF